MSSKEVSGNTYLVPPGASNTLPAVESTVNINALPEDLIKHVLSFLPGGPDHQNTLSLCNTALVCTVWKNVTYSYKKNILFKQLNDFFNVITFHVNIINSKDPSILQPALDEIISDPESLLTISNNEFNLPQIERKNLETIAEENSLNENDLYIKMIETLLKLMYSICLSTAIIESLDWVQLNLLKKTLKLNDQLINILFVDLIEKEEQRRQNELFQNLPLIIENGGEMLNQTEYLPQFHPSAITTRERMRNTVVNLIDKLNHFKNSISRMKD